MNVDDIALLKRDVHEGLLDAIAPHARLLVNTDERLLAYCQSVALDANDAHCVWEVLAVSKFLRLLDTYDWDVERVRRFVRFYESLLFEGLKGRQHYKLTPVQVFQFANIFGFLRPDGRRLVRQAILFVPRKFGKTTSVASLAVNDLLFGDSNGQAYMAANSQLQSGICFREAKNIVSQVDPDGSRFRVTANEITWKRNKLGKSSMIARLSAGAKTKDGLNASLVIFDEYAAARYVKDHSDGAELLNVLTSSFGVRPEPLTVIITTAGRVIKGPFEQMLEGAKHNLLSSATGGDGADWQFASLFQPDPWEIRAERFGDEVVWRKCNPHIGVTIQPDFYATEWAMAQSDPEKRKEFLCKYLNVFQTDKVRDWITPSTVHDLQTDKRIGDLNLERSTWYCFVGMDFSRGDDLCAMTYLCYNKTEKRFFVDVDAWITRNTLETNTNGTLYREWVDAGWLHVVDGDVIPEQVVTDRISEVAEHVHVMRIGYDPYDARVFINYLEAWLRTQRVDPSKMVRGVRQTWGQFNSSVQTMERLVKLGVVEFSGNPLWPWCFGNAVLEEDKFGNLKPVKRSANAKIDPVICALEGIILLDEMMSAGGK